VVESFKPLTGWLNPAPGQTKPMDAALQMQRQRESQQRHQQELDQLHNIAKDVAANLNSQAYNEANVKEIGNRLYEKSSFQPPKYEVTHTEDSFWDMFKQAITGKDTTGGLTATGNLWSAGAYAAGATGTDTLAPSERDPWLKTDYLPEQHKYQNTEIALGRALGAHPELIEKPYLLMTAALADMQAHDIKYLATMDDMMKIYTTSIMTDDGLKKASQTMYDRIMANPGAIAAQAFGDTLSKVVSFTGNLQLDLEQLLAESAGRTVTKVGGGAGMQPAALNISGGEGMTSAIFGGAQTVGNVLGGIWRNTGEHLFGIQHAIRTESDIRRNPLQGSGQADLYLGTWFATAVMMNFAGKGFALALKGLEKTALKSTLEKAGISGTEAATLEQLHILAQGAELGDKRWMRLIQASQDWLMHASTDTKVISKLLATYARKGMDEPMLGRYGREALNVAENASGAERAGAFITRNLSPTGKILKDVATYGARHYHVPLNLELAAQLVSNTNGFGLGHEWDKSWERTTDGEKYKDPITHAPISFGREVASAVGGEPNTWWYNMVSGPLDFLSWFEFDPFQAILTPISETKQLENKGMLKRVYGGIGIRSATDVYNLAARSTKFRSFVKKVVDVNKEAIPHRLETAEQLKKTRLKAIAESAARMKKKGMTQAQIDARLAASRIQPLTDAEAATQAMKVNPKASSIARLYKNFPELASAVRPSELEAGENFIKLLSEAQSKDEVVELFASAAKAHQYLNTYRAPSYSRFMSAKDWARVQVENRIENKTDKLIAEGRYADAAKAGLDNKFYRMFTSMKPVYWDEMRKFSNEVVKIGDPKSLDMMGRMFRASGVDPLTTDLLINRLAMSKSAQEWKNVYWNWAQDTFSLYVESQLQEIVVKSGMTVKQSNQVRNLLSTSFKHAAEELGNPFGGGGARNVYSGADVNGVVNAKRPFPEGGDMTETAGLGVMHEHYLPLFNYNAIDNIVRDVSKYLKSTDGRKEIVNAVDEMLAKPLTDKLANVQKQMNAIEINHAKMTGVAATPKTIEKPLPAGESIAPVDDALLKEAGVSRADLGKKPYDFQNANQEQIIHSGWNAGNWYRKVLESTGDIFRELSVRPKFAGPEYIEEKMKLIEKQFTIEKEVSRKERPLDYSFADALTGEPDKIAQLVAQWKAQPFHTEAQRIAVELNLAALKGDLRTMRTKIDELKRLKAPEGHYPGGLTPETVMPPLPPFTDDPAWITLNEQADKLRKDKSDLISAATGDYRFYDIPDRMRMSTSNGLHSLHTMVRQRLIDDYFRKMTLATGSFSMRVSASEAIPNAFRVGVGNYTKAALSSHVERAARQYAKDYKRVVTPDEMGYTQKRIYNLLTSFGKEDIEFYGKNFPSEVKRYTRRLERDFVKGLTSGKSFDKFVQRMTKDILINGYSVGGLSADHADVYAGGRDAIGAQFRNLVNGHGSGPWAPNGEMNANTLAGLGKVWQDITHDPIQRTTAKILDDYMHPENFRGATFQERLDAATTEIHKVTKQMVHKNPALFDNIKRSEEGSMLPSTRDRIANELLSENGLPAGTPITGRLDDQLKERLQKVDSLEEWANANIQHIMWATHGRGSTGGFNFPNMGDRVFHRRILSMLGSGEAPTKVNEVEKLIITPDAEHARVLQHIRGSVKSKGGGESLRYHDALYHPSATFHDEATFDSLTEGAETIPKLIKKQKPTATNPLQRASSRKATVKGTGLRDRYGDTSGKVHSLFPDNIPTQMGNGYDAPNFIDRFSDRVHDVVSRRVIDSVARRPLYAVELNAQLDFLEPLIKSGAITEDLAFSIAQSRAINQGIKYVHNPQDRMLFEQWSRAYAPFWFAQNQALRRMGRLALQNPAAFEKYMLLQLMFMQSGATAASSIDSQNSALIPGSTLGGRIFTDVLKSLGLSPSGNVPIGLAGSLTSLNSVFPWNDPSGLHTGSPTALLEHLRPQFGPLVSLPLKAIESIWPYGMKIPLLHTHISPRKISETVLGDVGANVGSMHAAIPNPAIRALVGTAISVASGGRVTDSELTSPITSIQYGLIPQYYADKSNEVIGKAKAQAQKDWNVRWGGPEAAAANPDGYKTFIQDETMSYMLNGYEDPNNPNLGFKGLAEYWKDPAARHALANDTSLAAQIIYLGRTAISFFSPVSTQATQVQPELQKFIHDLYGTNGETQKILDLVKKHPEAISFIEATQSASTLGIPLDASINMAIYSEQNKDLFTNSRLTAGAAMLLPYHKKGSERDSHEYNLQKNSGLRSKYTPDDYIKNIARQTGNWYMYEYLPQMTQDLYGGDDTRQRELAAEHAKQNIPWMDARDQGRTHRQQAFISLESVLNTKGIDSRPGLKETAPLARQLISDYRGYQSDLAQAMPGNYDVIQGNWQQHVEDFRKKNPVASVLIDSLFKNLSLRDVK